ncbi:hypothetical protein CARUB_v10003206mg, partial [Capsella rubella]
KACRSEIMMESLFALSPTTKIVEASGIAGKHVNCSNVDPQLAIGNKNSKFGIKN